MNVRDQQAENTKSAILKVAAEMFLSQGYQATSTRKIAQELNITQPNMYHYYKNKKVLYIKALEHVVSGFSDSLLEEYKENQDLPFEELLLKISQFMIGNFKINYFIMRNDIETFFTPEERKEIMQNWDGGYYKVLFNVFQSHKEELRSDLAIPVQVGTFLTMLLPYIEYNDAKRKRNIANLKTVINIFINGITKK
ncbi:TetR/AcrR family transcriptional regulator [Companilactobacillus pabuli]|jgi:AcrR family transcriptional regulator|uniref:TetR/AcrR family transcriptional regulator n=1 Tax=Companilactobacillus pabuli TaxID=2714036 RepID=A0A7L7L017_9LACO|nr:TetR/AcrR family transcriptional regulator [Companilactobacillus pabuli]AKP02854.1 transcriptional regulator [Companilactobacillus farciminis]AKS51153.1 transcriptional regulator [Companilactobacillus farciminis]MDG5114310.1 TetR/AcrR family transcriptional regulator [Companilactobacillus pabuli]QMT85039.1 TetR/AcrR family transcriptional regulator [Companilactobacillus pabuli]